MKTLIKDGTIVNEGHQQKADILIVDERIVSIFPCGTIDADCDNIVDATDCYVLPGIIDTHVHFREPGLTHKADMQSESLAALAGGVTSVFEMPNTQPQTTTLAAWEDKMQMAQNRMHVNYAFFPGATNDNLEELRRFDVHKIPGIKLFMGSSTGNMLVDKEQALDGIFSLAHEMSLPLMAHCEDTTLINQHIQYYKQLTGSEDPDVKPIIGMEEPERYRNKATFAVSEKGDVGFVRRKSHDVVHLNDCKLQPYQTMAISNALSEYMDLEFVRGNITKLMVRYAPGYDEAMAAIEAKNPNMPNIERMAGMLNESCGYALESLKINDRTIAGKSVITDSAGGLDFEISADSFYQVNPVQMVELYEKAMDYADIKGGETVLDLYCGVGTIGLFAAKRMNNTGRVIGIESVKQAVIDANRNSVINGIVNTWYVAGKAEDVLPGIMGIKPYMGYDEFNNLVEKEPPVTCDHADVVFLDPPRAGCEEELLSAVVQAAPDRIVYVSCDPATLARDIKYLTEKEYSFIEATPVDMFPHTGHVETVVLMSRVEGK